MNVPLSAPVSRPIIFFGTEDLSVLVLKELIAAGYPIAAVVTKPDRQKGRGKKIVSPPVKLLAEEHHIPVWQPSSLSEIIDNIKALQSVVGVLVSFGRIIPQSILDLFEPGIINVHPSLLPKYRGPSPIEAAILNNDTETGVTIMQLTAKMDAGPLYAQKIIDLEKYRANHNNDTLKHSLYTSLGLLGAELLIDLLPRIISGDIEALLQDDSQATYCELITKQDGAIDWHTPANHIASELDAYKGWPGSSTSLNGINIIITDGLPAYPVAKESNVVGKVFIDSNELKRNNQPGEGDYPLLYVVTGKNDEGRQTYFEINRLKPAGKKEMSSREFINGYGHLFKDSYIQ